MKLKKKHPRGKRKKGKPLGVKKLLCTRTWESIRARANRKSQ